jgi:hypothetical protein
VTTDIEALRAAARLLDQLEDMWRARLDRFGDVLTHDAPAG